MIPQLKDIIRYWDQRSGSREAVTSFTGQSLTYGELSEKVASACDFLDQQNVGKGKRVALSLPNSLDYIIWLFAVLQSGATGVALDPRLKPEELQKFLDASTASFHIACGPAKPGAEWQDIPALDCSEKMFGRHLNKAKAHDAQPHPECVLISFSSGSSGAPKSIWRLESQIYEDYRHFVEALEISEQDRFLALPPFYHAFGALGLFAILAAGGRMQLVNRFLPAKVLETAGLFKPTLMLATPPMIETLGQCHLKPGQESVFSQLRHAISSTGFLSRKGHQDFLERFGISTKIQYGSSETLSTTLTFSGDYLEGRVGRPYPGVEVAVFDDENQKLPQGSVGRIGVLSAANCSGYGEQQHQLKMIGSFILPGDTGMVDANGELHILGRDDIFNIGGYKVARAEVEQVIRTAFNVNFVAVLQYERSGQASLRAIIESDDPTVRPESVGDICRQRLSSYKVPSRIDIFARLPRDENGKVTLATLKGMD
jgi:acyl-CoA synthetase (AMP-forming)/AMP-acid ligase II